MATENEQSWSQQFRPFSTKVGGLFSGPGRQLYDISTHAPIQEAAKYPLLFSALSNLVGGRNTNAFNPIEDRARKQFQTQTVPSIAQRFASVGDTAGSSGFAGELAKAGTDLESQLAAERGKFGQEEERLRQSGLDQLLKFGMQPTSEKILMQKPEGEIPPTFEKAFGEVYGPHIAEKYGEFKNWADQALADIEGKKPEERGYLESAALKGGRAAQAIGRPIEKAAKAAITPGTRGAASAEVATKEWQASPEAKSYPDRIKGNAKAEQFREPEQQRELNEIMDIAGVKSANELELFNPKNRKTNKNKLTYEAIQRFNELAHDPAMRSKDPNFVNVLKNLRDEKEIERMRLYFTLPNPSRTLIPSHLAKKIPYWGKVRNKSYVTPRRGR